MSHNLANEEYLDRLEKAVKVGFYKTEAAIGNQTPIPWLGRTCSDCPFFERSHVTHATSGHCTLFKRSTSNTAHTCAYFDPSNHQAAQDAMAQRMTMTMPQWDQWMRRHRIPADTNER